ncbi:Gametocyte-specific factor 1 [Frankliniella fusca]|uniref:Gametocyte-specific factor 1 n=1 Tax=Frankliniella fusca TaxID=407009 RepID=A0AAE1HGU4_9NEOP|nr:Gametocyte-specific factor 1 [Frankliniella fusca]
MSHATEKYITCPYNQAHTILAYRFQTHLQKCRRNHPSEERGICAHNSTHDVPIAELKARWHEDYECPDRHSFQAQAVTFSEVKPLIPIDHIQLPEPEENWDDEPINVFNPMDNAKEKSLIRGIHCVTPSERKQFREEHRKYVESNDNIATKVKLNAQAKKPSASKENEQMKPLRAPRELPKGFNIGRGIKRATDEASPAQAPPSNQLPGRPSNLAGMQWHGMGRGRPISPPETSSPQGAWANGKLKF